MTPDAEGADLVESAHRFMRGMESSSTVTIAAVNSIAFGGGCELRWRATSASPRSRPRSASRDQPRAHPRGPAAPSGCRGWWARPSARDEPGRRTDRRLRGAPRRAGQPGRARPQAVRHGARVERGGWRRRRRSRSRRSSSARTTPISTRGSPPRPRASGRRSARRTPRRASRPSSASAGPPSRVDERRHLRAAGSAGRALHDAERAVVLTGAGVSVPSGIPTSAARGRGCGGVDPMEVAHRRVAARPRSLLAPLRRPLRVADGQAAQRGTWRWPSSSGAG